MTKGEYKRNQNDSITKLERTGIAMKQILMKKLITPALLIGILLSAAVPAVRVKAAETKKVWVLASKTSDSEKYKYTYNKKGLLTKNTCVKSNGGMPSYEYAYKGTKISNEFQILEGSRSETARYIYNKKGCLVKAASPEDKNYDIEYKWKNGRCVKTSDMTLSYDKNGWITKIDFLYGDPGIMTYDRHGYMLSIGGTDSSDREGFANTYKNGRLARQAVLDQNGEEYAGAYTFKYKKITVPASAVEKVERQQNWLTNKGSFQRLPLAAF